MAVARSPRARLLFKMLGYAGLVALVIVACGGWVIDYGLRSVPIRGLLASPGDDHTYLAARLLRRQSMSDTHAKAIRINVVGASTVRESFSSTDSALSSRISSRLGLPVQFNNLGSTAQNLRESLVLVDNVGSGGRCFNLVGVSPLRFQFPDGGENRFPLRSDVLGRFDREHGSRGLIGGTLSSYYHWPWLTRWWWARMERRRGPDIDYVAKRHLRSRALPTSYLDSEWRRLAAKNPGILQNLSFNLRVLGKIVETSKSNGCRTILFEQVHHPKLLELQRPIENSYRAGLETVLRKYDLTYVDYRRYFGFDAGDFADHLHLGLEGKKRFEAWFLREVVYSDMMSGDLTDAGLDPPLT